MKRKEIILLIITLLFIVLPNNITKADWINSTVYNETFQNYNYLNETYSSAWIDTNVNRHWAKIMVTNSIITDEYFDDQSNNTPASGWSLGPGQILISDTYKNGSVGYSAHIYSSGNEMSPSKNFTNYPSDNFSIEFDIFMKQQENVLWELDVGDFASQRKSYNNFGALAYYHTYYTKTTPITQYVNYSTWYHVKLNFTNAYESIYYNNNLIGTADTRVSVPFTTNGIAFNPNGCGTGADDGIYIDNLLIYKGNNLTYYSNSTLTSKLLNFSTEIEQVILRYYSSIPSGTDMACYVKSNITGENWKPAQNNTSVPVNLTTGVYYFCNLTTTVSTISPSLTNILLEAITANILTDCTNINSSGRYYLNNNIINSSNSYCINISANNVILDCRGHVIDGNNSQSGIYIYRDTSNTTNITIRNCTVTEWNFAGIYTRNANSNLFEYVNASSNVVKGVYVQNGSYTTITNSHAMNNGDGIYIEYGYNNTIANSYTTNNIGSGVYLEYCSNITITETSMNDNGDYGIYIEYGENNTIQNSYVNTNTYGIYDESSIYTLIKNTSFFTNGYGIYIQGANNNTIIDSYANKNIYGMYVDTSSGNIINRAFVNNSEYAFYFKSSYDTTINASSVINNSYGVYLISSYNNTVITTTITNNTYGIYIDQSYNNTLYNNLLNNTYNFNYTKMYGNTWNKTLTLGTNIIQGAYLGGNFWALPHGSGFSETCTDLDANGICDIAYNLSENNSDYLPLVRPDIQAPLINFVLPTTATGSSSSTSITANVTASDINLVNITLSLYSTAGLVNQTNSSVSPLYYQFSSLSDGTYYLNATAYDAYNHTNSTETRTIAISTTVPSNPPPTGGGSSGGGGAAVAAPNKTEEPIAEKKISSTVKEENQKKEDKDQEKSKETELNEQVQSSPENEIPLISGAATQKPGLLDVVSLEASWGALSLFVLIFVFILIKTEQHKIASLNKKSSIVAKQKYRKKRAKSKKRSSRRIKKR